MVFYSTNPFGDERADFRIGQLSALTANLKKGKNQKSFSPYDFMPFIKKPEKSKQALIDSIKRTFT